MEIFEREVEFILDCKLSDDVNDFKDCIEREYRYDHKLHWHGNDNIAGPDIALRVVAGIAGAIVAPSLLICRHRRRRPDKGTRLDFRLDYIRFIHYHIGFHASGISLPLDS